MPVKPIPLRTLLDEGLLFEINRQVLHPFGFALAMEWDDKGAEGEPDRVVLLQTDDRDGMTFSTDAFLEGEEKLRAFLEKDGSSRLSARRMFLGFVHQVDPDQIKSGRPGRISDKQQ